MQNIKLTISFDGSGFNGWQKQDNATNTIQALFEEVLSEIFNENIEVISSGRTDAGVHAIAQCVNFKITEEIDFKELELKKLLNEKLIKSVVVKKVEFVEERFHARYNAKGKVYKYRVLNSTEIDPFRRKYVYCIEDKINVEKMKEASKYLIGEHDFSAFTSDKRKKKAKIRTIDNIRIELERDEIVFYLEGNGFLYNMVRIIVGTLLNVGIGKIKPEDVEKILNSKERKNAGRTLPPNALFLVKVYY